MEAWRGLEDRHDVDFVMKTEHQVPRACEHNLVSHFIHVTLTAISDKPCWRSYWNQCSIEDNLVRIQELSAPHTDTEMLRYCQKYNNSLLQDPGRRLADTIPITHASVGHRSRHYSVTIIWCMRILTGPRMNFVSEV